MTDEENRFMQTSHRNVLTEEGLLLSPYKKLEDTSAILKVSMRRWI